MVGKGEAVINKKMQGLAAVGLAVLLGTAGCASQPQGADPHASASLQTAVDSSSREKEDSSLPSSSRDAAGEPGAASKMCIRDRLWVVGMNSVLPKAVIIVDRLNFTKMVREGIILLMLMLIHLHGASRAIQ